MAEKGYDSEQMRRVTVTALGALTNGDSRMAHTDADSLLVAFLRAEGYGDVADAYEAAADRCLFECD